MDTAPNASVDAVAVMLEQEYEIARAKLLEATRMVRSYAELCQVRLERLNDVRRKQAEHAGHRPKE